MQLNQGVSSRWESQHVAVGPGTNNWHRVCEKCLAQAMSTPTSAWAAFTNPQEDLTVTSTMHAQHLVELAAQLTDQFRGLTDAPLQLQSKGVEQYWVASRCRLDRWSSALSEHSDRMMSPDASLEDLWHEIRPTLDEVLLSEVLTRVWSAILVAYDRSRGTSEYGPVARSIFTGHCEARHRALKLLFSGQGLGVEHAVAHNRLRRRCELWTDTLLAALGDENGSSDLAFDRRRVESLAGDLHQQPRRGIGNPAWQVVLASLRAAIQREELLVAANDDLNQQVAAGIIACFSPNAFDAVGNLTSAWLVRISTITEETEVMLDELFGDELNNPLQEEGLGRIPFTTRFK